MRSRTLRVMPPAQRSGFAIIAFLTEPARSNVAVLGFRSLAKPQQHADHARQRANKLLVGRIRPVVFAAEWTEDAHSSTSARMQLECSS